MKAEFHPSQWFHHTPLGKSSLRRRATSEHLKLAAVVLAVLTVVILTASMLVSLSKRGRAPATPNYSNWMPPAFPY